MRKSRKNRVYDSIIHKLYALEATIHYFLTNYSKDNLVTTEEYIKYYNNTSSKGKLKESVREMFKSNKCISRVTVHHSMMGAVNIDFNRLENIDGHANPDIPVAKWFFDMTVQKLMIELDAEMEEAFSTLASATTERKAKSILKSLEKTLLEKYIYFYHV